jgi:hypothetical protein
MSHEMLISKAGIDFSSPSLLFACGTTELSFPQTQHVMTTNLKSYTPSHRIDVSKDQFHNEIDLQGIDSVESVLEVLKSLKILALCDQF